MSYNYTTKTGSLKDFLERVKSKELGIPDKVTLDYLESIGYKSTNDRPIVRVLKSINFIDNSGVPTPDFENFRTENSKQVMASALRKTYAELFKIYPDPLKKTNTDLENFFAKKEPSLKKGTLEYYVATFKTLCEFADFEAEPFETEGAGEKRGKEPEGERGKAPIVPKMPEGLSINLNIQITLPVTDNAEVYDKIFEALKKHIFNRS